MKRSIIIWPDPVLMEPSKDVPADVDPSVLKVLQDDLIETMNAAGGVGLAAIQIGVHLRAFAMKGSHGDEVWINPKVTPNPERGYRSCEEGCLSVPGFQTYTTRFREVEIEGMILDTHYVKIYADLSAQIVQHEYEHLMGGIFLDQVSSVKRDSLRTAMKKAARLAKAQGKTLSELIYGF